VSRTFREERAELPEHLADVVTAVVVTQNFRPEDVLAVARRLAPSYQNPHIGRPRDLYELIVGHLEHDGAKPAESVLEKPHRRITLHRSGTTNVIRVFIFDTGNVDAYVMRESRLAEEGRRCRDAFYYRLTRRPISNDNDPRPRFRDIAQSPFEPETIEVASPGLHTRMAVKGRLASIAKQPGLRVRNGVWEDASDRGW
jgi:hypothetical protein